MLSRSALVIFAIVLAEFVAIGQSINAFGFLVTLGLLAGLSVIGVLVLRWKAAGLVVSTLESLTDNQVETTRQVADRGLGLAAGALLVVPGLVSGALGLLLLLAPVRRLVEPHLLGWFSDRAGSFTTVRMSGFPGSGSGSDPRFDDSIIDVDEVPRNPDARPNPTRSELD